MRLCVLFDRECIDCGQCDMCDIEPNKRCTNCCKCIESDADFKAIKITEIILPQKDKSVH